MNKIFSSFIEGYGSILNFFSLSEQDDFENLKKDWQNVGSYLKQSIYKISGENNPKDGKTPENTRRK